MDSILKKHRDCAKIGPMKDMFMKAVNEGGNGICPKCGTSGRKDDACTHISCPNCTQRYCYLCCVGEDKCDKGGSKRNIYDHNIEWETHRNRCPMYMKHIH